ncbi:MAG: helix-turn-helix domain-containing protein [Pseudomonadota bacterium]
MPKSTERKALTERQLLARDAKRDLNAELLAGLRDVRAGRIGRVWKVDAAGKVREVYAARARQAVALSQSEFARLLGVSVRTLQQWEQGRREPRGAAKTLIALAAEHPATLRKFARERALEAER